MNARLTKYFISTQASMFPSFSVNIFCTHATRGRFISSSLVVVVTYSFILWWRLFRSLVLFLFAFLKRKKSTQLSYKCEASVLGLVYCSLEGKKMTNSYKLLKMVHASSVFVSVRFSEFSSLLDQSFSPSALLFRLTHAALCV